MGYNNGMVENSYATGNVSGTSRVGGLVGSNWGSVDNSFYHEDMPECDAGEFGSIALSDEEFGSISTFEYAGWDIEMVETDRAHPFLSWEENKSDATWLIKGTEQTFNLTIEIDGGGYTDPVAGTHLIYEHGKIVIEAYAEEGHYFVNWTGDVESENKTIVVTVDTDKTITANFKEMEYEISTWKHLHNIRHELHQEYTLVSDLDENTEGYEEYVGTDKGWLPLGDGDDRFNGSFDGCGHTISGLYINRTGMIVGLFGYVGEDGEISNVGLVDVEVSGSSSVGGLVGRNWGGTVENSYATGTVSGEEAVGGLVGWNIESLVENSYATGTVSGGMYIGGLVGWNWGGTVENSHATGDVSGNWYVGGLVGQNYESTSTVSNSYSMGGVSGVMYTGGLVGSNSGTVENSYATGNVIGSDYDTGGLVGANSGMVSNTYATGAVSGTSWVGGLVGSNSGTVEKSYATGNVSGTGWDVGGLVGSGSVAVSNSFWDIETSGIDVSDGGIGLPTAQMKMESTFTSVGWDFDGTWWMIQHVSYPLLHQDTTPPTVNIQSPVDLTYFGVDEVSVEWSGSDEETGISHYEIRINEGDWADVGQATIHTFSDLDEGNYTVDVMAFDHAGNSALDSVNFTVDLTPPVIEIISPYDGAVIADNDITVRWNGSDELSGIAFYEIRLNYGGWMDDPGTDTEFTFHGLNELNYRVDVRATDRAGNRATHNITFTVALSPPTINITSPADGVEELTYEEDFTIEGSTEPGVSLWINGESVGVDGDGNFSYQTTLAEGLNVFKVVAGDQAGNTAEATVYALYLPQIPEIMEAIDSLEDGIQENRDNITALQEELEALDIDLGPLTERVDALEIALDENITELENAIDENRDDITDIQDNITSIWDEMQSLEKDIENIWSHIGEIDDSIVNIRGYIEHLNETTDDLWVEIGEVEFNLTEKIDALQMSMEENVTALETLISENADNISVVQEDISDIYGNIMDIWEELQELDDEIINIWSSINDLFDALESTLTEDEINDLLHDYLKAGDLEAVLEDYLTNDEIDTLLDSYITEARLEEHMGEYLTDDEISEILDNYVSSTTLEELLSDYLSDAEIDELLDTMRGDIMSELEDTMDDYVQYSDLEHELEEQKDEYVSPLALIGLIAAVLAILIALFAVFKKGGTEVVPLDAEDEFVDDGSLEEDGHSDDGASFS